MNAPAFSDGAMPAYAALYQPYNDIDVYVEDRTFVGMYEAIFSRLLADSLRVFSVIPLGNSENVKSEALRLQGDTSRRRFFLIDGDFGWIHCNGCGIKDVYMLKCYSIENLAWDYVHITELARVLSPELTSAEIMARLPVKMLFDFVQCIHPLFVLYAVCQALESTCSTVSFSVARLIDRPTLACDKVAVRRRMFDLYKHLVSNFSKEVIRSEKTRIEKAIAQIGCSDGRFISGKDYLIQFLMFAMQDRFGFRGNRNQLVADILTRCDFSVDPDFKRAVEAKRVSTANS